MNSNNDSKIFIKLAIENLLEYCNFNDSEVANTAAFLASLVFSKKYINSIADNSKVDFLWIPYNSKSEQRNGSDFCLVLPHKEEDIKIFCFQAKNSDSMDLRRNAYKGGSLDKKFLECEENLVRALDSDYQVKEIHCEISKKKYQLNRMLDLSKTELCSKVFFAHVFWPMREVNKSLDINPSVIPLEESLKQIKKTI